MMQLSDKDQSFSKAAQSNINATESPAVSLAEETIDKASETKLLAKLDAFLVPIIMLVYLSCFLDRANIGNVKTAGMQKDIHASTQQFSTAVSIFYATYVAFETPWAVLLKKLTPRVVIAGLCLVWALTTIFSGFITNVPGLYAARLILGVCEGGLFPSLNLYLTMVYRREEMAKRVSYLFVCAALAGAFGGLMAYGILHMNGVAGYAGWRWVYIIEGIFSVLVAALVWFGLPTDPSNAYFLNDHDKHLMQIRAHQRAAYMGSEEFSWEEVKNALRDPKVYLSAIIQFLQDILLYGFSTFLPSIIQSFHKTSLQTQYLTIPVYLVAAIAFMALAFLSDRFLMRSPFLLFANMFGIVGYVLLLADVSNAVKFFGCFLCSIAVYTGPGLNMAWLNVNMAPQYRRATAIGVQQSIANTAGIVAGQIYRKSPYVLGNGFSLGAICLAQVFIIIKYFYIRRCNEEKRKIAVSEKEDTRKVTSGDQAVDFVYHL